MVPCAFNFFPLSIVPFGVSRTGVRALVMDILVFFEYLALVVQDFEGLVVSLVDVVFVVDLVSDVVFVVLVFLR